MSTLPVKAERVALGSAVSSAEGLPWRGEHGPKELPRVSFTMTGSEFGGHGGERLIHSSSCVVKG